MGERLRASQMYAAMYAAQSVATAMFSLAFASSQLGAPVLAYLFGSFGALVAVGVMVAHRLWLRLG